MLDGVAPEPWPLAGFHDLEHDVEDFREVVLEGLSRPQKQIPAKYFYDAAGSRLFDRICELPEYYPTRTEIALLTEYRGEIAELAGPRASLIEFGSGSSVKVRILLDALDRPAAYLPIDISRDHLVGAARRLAEDYPGIAVTPICADYTRDFALPAAVAGPRQVGFFPGSTIGNFTPAEAEAFLRRSRALLGPDSGLLIGVDLVKDEALLHAAYNDAAGVTAAFNRNLLARINRELGAAIDLDSFTHHAPYNAARACIEMHLVSRRRQSLEIAGAAFRFEAGESIHTEDSHKFTVEGFQGHARNAGWHPLRAWVDRERLFSVHYLAPA